VESIRIRTARSEDLPVLRRIYRRASLANEGDREALLANPDAWVLAADRVAEGRTRVAVTAEGTILGFATGVPVENSTLELEDLFVEPDRVRHGIATRLVADQTEHARRNGIVRIRVTANPHAYAFYCAVGFAHLRSVDTPFGTGSLMEFVVADDGT
jgi:GNAT superfamily N-acetyltransferase